MPMTDLLEIYRPNYMNPKSIENYKVFGLPEQYQPHYLHTGFGVDSVAQHVNLLGYSESNLIALAFLKSIYRQVVINDMSLLVGVEGRHRSGKSTTVSLLGYLLDRTFWKYYNERLVIEPREFMDAIEGIRKRNIHGAVIQVEEAGVGMASSDRFEEWSKVLEKTVQMIGWLNPMFFFICPIKSLVNPTMRRMMQLELSVRRANKKYNMVIPKELFYIQKKTAGEWRTRYPLINFMGEKKILSSILITKPPQFIVDRYEKFAEERKPRLFRSLQDDVRRSDAKAIVEKRDLDKLVDEVVLNHKNFWSNRADEERVKLSKAKIRFGFSIPDVAATYVLEGAEQKLNEISRMAAKEKAAHEPTISVKKK